MDAQIQYITDQFNIHDTMSLKSSQKILIVDDQSFNIQALKVILKFKIGIDVDSVCDFTFDGLEAINMIEADVREKLKK
jgi:PleD family two-component response regulator